MTDPLKPPSPEAAATAEGAITTRRPYEPPQCEKKRSIHRVTLLSGMGVMSVGVLSTTG